MPQYVLKHSPVAPDPISDSFVLASGTAGAGAAAGAGPDAGEIRRPELWSHLAAVQHDWLMIRCLFLEYSFINANQLTNTLGTERDCMIRKGLW